jgi:hypothetical protein
MGQRKSVMRVAPTAMIRLRRSQSPFRKSRPRGHEYKARSYGDAGTSSGGRRVKKTTTAQRERFNGVVALTATSVRAGRRMCGESGEPDGREPPRTDLRSEKDAGSAGEGFRNDSPCAVLVQRETGTLLAPLAPQWCRGEMPLQAVSRLLWLPQPLSGACPSLSVALVRRGNGRLLSRS